MRPWLLLARQIEESADALGCVQVVDLAPDPPLHSPPSQNRGHGDMERGDTVVMMSDIRTAILRSTNVNLSNPSKRSKYALTCISG